MEQRSLLASAVGMGVGVGLGLASARWAKPAHAAEGSSGSGAGAAEVEAELRRLVVDGRDSDVTFDEFHHLHCYLSEQTREVLISAAFVHLKQTDLSKHIRNLSAASRAILLSGPTEAYLQSLAKALSHYYKARLLLLDVTDFSLRIQSKYGGSSKALVQNQSVSETTFGRVSDFIGSFAIFPKKDEPRESLRRQTSSADSRARGSDVASNDPLLQKNASMPSDMSDVGSQCSVHSARRASSWCFDEKVLIQSLYKVMISVAESDPIILYIRDVDHFLHRSQRTYSMFQKMLAKLSGQVLILGSRLLNSDAEYSDVDNRVSSLFPYHVDIKPPQEEIHLNGWKTQMEEDAKKIQIQDNRNHIVEVLSANDLDCDDLSSICQADTMVLSNYIEEIIVSAVSYHLVHNKDPEYKNGKLLLSSKSLSHGLSIFQETGLGGKDTLKLEANEDGLKGAPGSKKPENDKSPVKDGDAPPPKPVSSVRMESASSLAFKRRAYGLCYRCLAPEHFVADCRGPVRCLACGLPGHRERGCPSRQPLEEGPHLCPRSPPASPRRPRDLPDCRAPRHCSHPTPGSPHPQRRSWASVVAPPAAADPSMCAAADLGLLEPLLPSQMEVLRSEMQALTVSRLEEVVQPLRDMMTTLQGWTTLLGGFLERMEVVAGRLGHLPELPLASAPMVAPAVGFMDEADVELFGSFSPRAGSSSTAPVLPDFEGEASAEVVSPVLKIMPELQVLCGEPVSPQPMEQLKPGSLQVSEVALVPSPPPVEPCQASASLPLGVMEREVLDDVVPTSVVVVASKASTPVPGALLAKEICDFLVALEAADPGSGKTIGCLLKEKAIRDKKRGGASSRPIILKEKSDKCRSKKSDAMRKASAVA